MENLTQGSIPRHIIKLAIPIAIGMIFQTLYHLVDLYFVAKMGDSAIAGLTSAGTISFLVMAFTQVIGVGTMALIAQASGRKDQTDANLIFNQSLGLAAVCALLTLAGGYSLTGWYMGTLGADTDTVNAGTQYLWWVLPGLSLQFALVCMGSALRGTGIVKPAIYVQVFTVTLNAALAPFMIDGWVTGRPLGVVGAGLSTSISISVGVLVLFLYFVRLERYVTFRSDQLRPRWNTWKRILYIGVPPGGEFVMMFFYMAVIYWAIRDFGPAAQAGFGAGSRVMQAIFLPAMAIAFATAPVSSQNVGARQNERVRETYRWAVLAGGAIMLMLTLLCQLRPELLVSQFTDDIAVIVVGGEFLQIISWNFVATGFIFTCSSLFQALGNTVPTLLASATRLVSFAIPAVLLSRWAGFELHHLWYLSVATVVLQAITSWWLLRIEFRRKLGPSKELGLARSVEGTQ